MAGSYVAGSHCVQPGLSCLPASVIIHFPETCLSVRDTEVV